ncbi:MAG: glycosyltransferase [Spirochaetes bacterium]|nr:glycosyltransferase [Spirochaetota bacterium]
MAKMDMHVHSKYSGRPSDWFLQKFGTSESYTEPEKVYELALKAGMDFVVITDHNQIEGAMLLKKKYPDKVIAGCEFTVYFPEDECKIHILVYDLDRKQFDELNILRNDIYLFRDYIKKNNMAYSVAHATYSVNGKVTIEHLEKMILLFDVFEGINGSRNRMGNVVWTEVLRNLNEEIIFDLYKKHNIEPMSSESWVKGFTGGSDDHGALFIGKTYTEADVKTVHDFIQKLKDKKTAAGGRNNDYRSFAFTLYKILYDFSKSKNMISNTVISRISSAVFVEEKFDLTGWIMRNKFKKIKKKDKENFLSHLSDLLEGLKDKQNIPIEEKFKLLFDVIADISDALIKSFVKSIKKRVAKQDYIGVFQSISGLLPSIFLTIPFFSTLTHMYMSKPLLNELETRFNLGRNKKKRIFWFTDTINDLNGVSVTLKKIGHYCHKTGRDLTVISALLPEEINDELPPNYFNLPTVYDFKMPNYETLTLKIPSMLKSVEMLYDLEPDEVYISSPGPVGLFGYLFARLINAKTTGVYHTDFSEQAAKITGHVIVSELIENGTRWFYNLLDRISVPTAEYIKILKIRGYNGSKMSVFKRGIDDDFIGLNDKDIFKKINDEEFTMIYAGRISEDKNLDFLINVFNRLKKDFNFISLKIAGDGPYLDGLKEKCENMNNIEFLGRIKRKKLVDEYLDSDLFVFPSNTDTFGMVVMEAQACGLPAVVSDIGGPQEIILSNKTGTVVSTKNPDEWIKAVKEYIYLKFNNTESLKKIKKSARENIIKNYNWEKIMTSIFDDKISNIGKKETVDKEKLIKKTHKLKAVEIK